MENINNYIDSIKKEIVLSEKEQRVERLIELLSKINSELNVVKNTLIKLQILHQKNNYNKSVAVQIEEKINTVERLNEKITKARLNLNFYFK